MYQITQAESFKLRERFPDISIKICSKRKKGANSKTYYCEEGYKISRFLDEIRKAETVT